MSMRTPPVLIARYLRVMIFALFLIWRLDASLKPLLLIYASRC